MGPKETQLSNEIWAPSGRNSGPGQAALAAVAVGEVILGDKEKAGGYKKYNDGHVPDLVQPGASAWGTDWIGRSVGEDRR